MAVYIHLRIFIIVVTHSGTSPAAFFMSGGCMVKKWIFKAERSDAFERHFPEQIILLTDGPIVIRHGT